MNPYSISDIEAVRHHCAQFTLKHGEGERGMTIKYTNAHTICATNESTLNDDDDVVNSLACRFIRNICGQNEIFYFDSIVE